MNFLENDVKKKIRISESQKHFEPIGVEKGTNSELVAWQ
jgi:hypothetical protein